MKPALTVRDHCLIVGAVAEALRRLLPPACQKLAPAGAATLAAAHDIGKITQGFLLKARPHWDFPNALGQGFCEGNHAKVSQAYLASILPGAVANRSIGCSQPVATTANIQTLLRQYKS